LAAANSFAALDPLTVVATLRSPMKFLCAILAVMVVSSFGFKAQAELADGIDAIVHDSIITFQDVEDTTAPMVDDLRRQYAADPDAYQKKVNEALKDALNQLVDRQLILHDFQTTYAGFPESIIDEQLQGYIKERYGNRVTLMKSLQQQGITYEKFRQQYRDTFIIRQMNLKTFGEENILISPHKMEVYYAAHTNDFQVEEQVKLRMIVLNKPTGDDAGQTRKLANDILTKINEGAAFAEMASVYSQGSQRSQGGDWGWVEKSVLRKDLGDVAFSLKAGEKSGVIETPDACYLMLVEDRRPAHVKALSEVRDEIEKILQSQEQKRLREQWLDRLKKKTFVRYF
jgi:peptidyl-prolyl cis-trans isomerase SurA